MHTLALLNDAYLLNARVMTSSFTSVPRLPTKIRKSSAPPPPANCEPLSMFAHAQGKRSTHSRLLHRRVDGEDSQGQRRADTTWALVAGRALRTFGPLRQRGVHPLLPSHLTEVQFRDVNLLRRRTAVQDQGGLLGVDDRGGVRGSGGAHLLPHVLLRKRVVGGKSQTRGEAAWRCTGCAARSPLMRSGEKAPLVTHRKHCGVDARLYGTQGEQKQNRQFPQDATLNSVMQMMRVLSTHCTNQQAMRRDRTTMSC